MPRFRIFFAALKPEEEYQIIKEYSEKKQLSMAEILRDYIKTLASINKKMR